MKKHIITISDKQLRKLKAVMQAYIESSRRLQASLESTEKAMKKNRVKMREQEYGHFAGSI